MYIKLHRICACLKKYIYILKYKKYIILNILKNTQKCTSTCVHLLSCKKEIFMQKHYTPLNSTSIYAMWFYSSSSSSLEKMVTMHLKLHLNEHLFP